MQTDYPGTSTRQPTRQDAGRDMSPSEADAAPQMRRTRPARRALAPMARALGWFSVGLGLTQVLAPRAVARATGMRDRPGLMRAVGLREIASGTGILVRNKPGWIWSRLVGDAMDLVLLGTAAADPARRQKRLALTAAALAGMAAVDVLASVQHARRRRPVTHGLAGVIEFEKSITVNREPDACYRFWRDFNNLPRFMQHVESVQIKSDTLSHWVAKGPAGATVEWDAEITADQPGQLLAWHSTQGAAIPNAGTVHFEREPGGRGTVIRVDLHYTPGGKPAAMVAKLFGEEPEQQIDDDLRQFKQLVETGASSSAGRSVGDLKIGDRW